ncbi:hypothetical protein ACMU_13820 [Actibacterium mucosum KCTC 23349]|uniref:ABC3 transporter permease protein domain-containing protein n=1 Tax=Actibacterium mucosum KCTC 23349 TaxID=1454373 RepID=A0A037ZFD7_9RHOB|nr:ABC transporter permease [Actibacterium mucosum]KAJ54838.1 hypothetical protein ACMU_13820 [Actibacterium mucosum KCTC 23349]
MWQSLTPFLQNIVLLLTLLAPLVVAGSCVLHGYRTASLTRALMWRYRWANILFVVLIAVSVGLGVGLLAQERGLRQGTALAAEKFNVVVGAPGSDVTLMMASVFLQPSAVPLIDGEVYARIADHPHATLTAPLAFGDSYRGAAVVGTTSDFVDYLSGGLVAGRHFQNSLEAVIGAAAPLQVGEEFDPDHGRTPAEKSEFEGAHTGAGLRVVGKMAPTGTPWDKAILVAVESVWELHGLANGHAPTSENQLGPPFDAAYFPGTPAAIVHTDQLFAAYALQAEFNQASETMAFFPGAVLSRLYRVLGDIRQVISVMAFVTQILVAVSVVVGLFVLTLLFRRQMALLYALGAPRRFITGVIWSYGASLLVAGALAGMALGQLATILLSRILSARTDILITAPLGWPEVHLVAGFVGTASVLALLPALAVGRVTSPADLRG